MKKFNTLFKKKPVLAITWQGDNCSLFLFDDETNLKYEANVPVGGIKEFLSGRMPARTMLIIPRSEVLQKETAWPGNLSQILPYSPDEMAYSLVVDPAGPSKALLYAVPEQKIKAILDNLASIGVAVDEVISEDQPLYWHFQAQAGSAPLLVLDQNASRVLALVLKENTIILSSAYSFEEPLKNILSELSFTLLEAGVKPLKAVVTAPIEAREVAKSFEIPVEIHEPETFDAKIISPVLSGAKKWGEHAAISLLPNARKKERHLKTRNQSLIFALSSYIIFLVCVFGLAAGHLFLLKHKKTSLETQISRLAPQVVEVRERMSALEAMHEAENSKLRLLSFLKDLSGRAPGSIRLRELEIDGKNIALQGESPSHALLSDMVQAVEKMDGIKDVKLEHARLRKRLGRDYFDFEVTARW